MHPQAALQLVSRGRETYRALLRELALADPWIYFTEVLNHPSIECDEGACCEKKRGLYEPLHRPWIERAVDLTTKRKGWLAPRGSFKSSVISWGGGAFLITTNPNIRILLLSALETNATKFLGQVKRTFQHNPRMKWLFPEHCVDPGKQFGNTSEFTVPSRTDYSLAAPTFTATYINAALASQHYDVIIFDDPIEAQHVATEEQAQKALDSYSKVLPLLDPGGMILMVGTRWAYFDLYSNLVPQELGGNAASSPYEWQVRACLERDGRPDFENGDPIFPTRFPRSVLMELLEECRSNPAKGTSFFWNQYMNQCRAPEAQPFLDPWFIEIPPEQVPPLMSKMICVDTALKDDALSGGGDYTAIWVGGWDAEGKLYLLCDGVFSNILKSKQFCDTVVALAQKYDISIVVKQKTTEDTIGTQLADAFSLVHRPLRYLPIGITQLGRKQKRIIDALQGPLQRSEVFFVRRPGPPLGNSESHPLLAQLKKELINLGQYPVDDAADGLANFFHPDIRSPRRSLVGASKWRVPNAPIEQLSNPMNQQWKIVHGKGAGWS